MAVDREQIERYLIDESERLERLKQLPPPLDAQEGADNENLLLEIQRLRQEIDELKLWKREVDRTLERKEQKETEPVVERPELGPGKEKEKEKKELREEVQPGRTAKETFEQETELLISDVRRKQAELDRQRREKQQQEQQNQQAKQQEKPAEPPRDRLEQLNQPPLPVPQQQQEQPRRRAPAGEENRANDPIYVLRTGRGRASQILEQAFAAVVRQVNELRQQLIATRTVISQETQSQLAQIRQSMAAEHNVVFQKFSNIEKTIHGIERRIIFILNDTQNKYASHEQVIARLENTFQRVLNELVALRNATIALDKKINTELHAMLTRITKIEKETGVFE